MSDLQQGQRDLVAYLRDPRQPPPGVDGRRLKLYRDLVFNNLDSLLAKAFPVLRTARPTAGWEALVGDFCREHRAHMNRGACQPRLAATRRRRALSRINPPASAWL